jgi:hypothetical protein
MLQFEQTTSNIDTRASVKQYGGDGTSSRKLSGSEVSKLDMTRWKEGGG